MKQMNGNSRLYPRLGAALAAILFTLVVPSMCEAGESPNYPGPAETRADLAHDGQLPWAVGASSYQVVRSVPSNPSLSDGSNASFRHHHFLAWWGDKFWVYHIAAAPNDESSKRGRLNWSADGITWANADSAGIFPTATHQRAAFYVAANNVFLVTTWYNQNGEKEGRGDVGSRLVRRINGPGDFGPIYVLRDNYKGAATIPGGNPPLYSNSSDAAFKTACAELLANKLYRQQFQEEDQDPAFYVVNGMGESPMARAFNWYTRNNGEIVGLWKYADTVATTWDFGQVPTPQDYTSRLKLCTNAKIWGCKTADGRFALFGNPYFLRNDTGTWEYQVRYPLAVSASADGITFDTPYATVEGDMDPMRYPDASYELFGDTKAVGHQYVRGIEEGFPRPADSNVWLVTSHHKEDIWVTRVPVPIVTRVTGPVSDDFQSVPPGGAVPRWNIRSEQWATVKVAQEGDNRFLRLTDKAEVGYAKAFRVFETVAASGGNDFGWSASGNVLGTAGEAGGIFARSQAYSTFADTTIGTLNRAGSTLRMTGSFRLANDAFDGHFYLGFFNPASLVSGQAPGSFAGIQIAEPAANAGDPFRGSAVVAGTGGNSSATIHLTQNTTLAFDLTWTGGADGAGTLSGTLAGQSVNVTVGAGAGNFTAFGLLSGGMASGNPAQKTAGCHFDNLGYTTSGGLASETFDTAATTEQAGWTGLGNGNGGTVANLSFRLRPHQANHGRLEVDVMDRKGQRPVRLAFDATGAVLANSGETMSQVGSYSPNQWMNVTVQANMEAGTYSLWLGGASVAANRPLAASIGSVERLEFRTGAYRLNDFTRRKNFLPSTTIAGADTMVTEAVFDIDDVAISGMKHVVVAHDPTKWCGTPANYSGNGPTWQWGEELLIGYGSGKAQFEKMAHQIDLNDPDSHRNHLARSKDGGATWETWVPEHGSPPAKDNLAEKAKRVLEEIDFSSPGFVMQVSGTAWFCSLDRGASWRGPFTFGSLPDHPELANTEFTPRTAYLVSSPRECLVFLSVRIKGGEKLGEMQLSATDKVFLARTTDGGKSFEFVSWIVSFADPYRAVMPAPVRISRDKLVVAIRRRNLRKDIHDDICWIDCYESMDNGQTWAFISKVCETGFENGNPPAMIQLADGRLCCVYADRSRLLLLAKYSKDEGKTWGDEQVLREDYKSKTGYRADSGYPRLFQRPDGKLVTVYFWCTPERPETHIAATIFSAPMP